MLEQLKWAMKRKIEKNAIKVNVGGEEILLKKTKYPFREWVRINPPLDEYGKVNWINMLIGGKANLIKLIFIMIVVSFFLLGYYGILNNECVQYCANLREPIKNMSP